MAKQLKLKALLEGIFEDTPQINKYEVTEGVRSYGIVGKTLYNNGNIMEIAKQLSHIAEQAHTHVMSETDDWFDQVSVNKNMKTLKGSVAEFKKAAVESHQLNQRLTGLYEDIGHVLNRYYEIDEIDQGDMDNDGQNEPDDEEYLDNKDKAIQKAAKESHVLNQRLTGLYEDIGHVLNRYYEIDEADKGDMDNDGKNEPDDEEYLDSKRAAITKAIKGETVGDPDGLAPDSPAKDAEDYKNEALDTDKAPNGGGDEDDYAARDGEDMKSESSQSNPHNVDGNNPNGGEEPDRDGEEMKEIKRSLLDVGGVVGIPALGQIARKFAGK